MTDMNRKTCGIICEYNPFHNGHQYQISQARFQSQADVMIGVMSGTFVQRGEPAITDKWKRAEAAIKGGLDIVFELPLPYVIQSASAFAHGGVQALKLAGCDFISFGSECGNLENLMEIAETSINPDHLKEMMKEGLSYPKAYSLLTSSMAPNDILAVSYLKEIEGTHIKPVMIERIGSYHDETIHELASATAIRRALVNHESLQNTTPMESQLKKWHVTMDQYYPYIRTSLLMTPPSVLSSYFMFSEGIENHLIHAAQNCSSWNTFLLQATTYRYTASRIRRCLVAMMLQITKQQIASLPEMNTLRVLAFNDNGRQWMHDHKEDVPIASRFAAVPKPWRDIEMKAAYLYASVLPEEIRNQLIKDEITGARYIR